MKKQFVLMIMAAFLGITAVNAQGGGQRMTPEERTKVTMEKMIQLNLDKDATTKVEAIMLDFNTNQQKAMQELRESGGDRDAMMAMRKELNDARDTKLKVVLTADQMTKWKDEIEPSMRPKRGGGQGGGGN